MTAPSRQARPRQRGITLVEALVALAVMAFGIMGVIGVQSTLRSTGDLSKQRAEAVRIAQASVEAARGFSVIDPPLVPDGSIDYQGIATLDADDVTGLSTNTTFSLSRTVTDLFTAPDARRAKAMTTSVTWPDRAGATQTVVLRTLVAAVPPGVAGALAAPARNPVSNGSRGRHPVIPTSAVDQAGEGTSSFTPPDSGGVRWIFNNGTGFITAICTGVDPASCTPVTARLLSGLIRFATGADQPTPGQAEVPPSEAEQVSVSVSQTLPTPAATVECYESLSGAYVAYFCALPVTSDSNPRWSGRSIVGGIDLATGLADAGADRFRVCRYTPVRSCHPAVGSTIWGQPNTTSSCTEPNPQTDPPTPARLMRNDDHPLDYLNVTSGLTNQNFLVIRAGDGTAAFTCPADDTGTEFINGNTWHHQPDA